jgi:hypothetical protein
MADKWDYLVKSIADLGKLTAHPLVGPSGGEARETALKRLGSEGWELVAIAGEGDDWWIFKRPVVEEIDPDADVWVE